MSWCSLSPLARSFAMTAALLEDDRVKSRRNEFRREASRKEFLNCGLEIADCGLESRSPALPGNETTRGSASAAPPATAQLASAPNEAEPRVSGFPGGAWEPDPRDESRSQALPGNETTRGSASAAPPATA